MKNNRTSLSLFIKEQRKKYALTQQEFSLRSGLGLRFVRELEQGKQTLRMDKVNQAINFFGYEISFKKIGENDE